MANEVFVDTSGWYALIDRKDAAHAPVAAAVRAAIGKRRRLVTTDYVLDESFTLAKARAGSQASRRLMDLVERTAALDVEWIGRDRFERAAAFFRKHSDQTYSFTDCTSFTLMKERRIVDAITSDDHFRIAGFHILSWT
jgi:uncharacterized protein